MSTVERRLTKLEESTSRTWPDLIEWWNSDLEPEAEAEKRLEAQLRKAGWQGKASNYPAKAIIVGWLSEDEEAKE